MFDHLHTQTAPLYFEQSVWHKLAKPEPKPVRPLVWGSLSVGLAGLLVAMYVSPMQRPTTPDPLAETYLTIDNPWVAHQPNELALLQ